MIAVWFSNGAASAVGLKLTVDLYGRENVRAINNPVAEEDEDNLRFQADVASWVGIEIEKAINPTYPAASAVEVWDRRKAMSFPRGAPCTIHLKKEARQHWENNNNVDWHVFGFTADERARHERFILTERSNLLPTLIDAGMTKDDCAVMLRDNGLELPRVYAEGYPNANCIGCVKATSPTYWNLVRKTRPEVFLARAEQSRRLGVRLVRVKNKRIFLDELSPNAVGRPLKHLKMPECGIHCEEKP
jgi:hypothetical protein